MYSETPVHFVDIEVRWKKPRGLYLVASVGIVNNVAAIYKIVDSMSKEHSGNVLLVLLSQMHHTRSQLVKWKMIILSYVTGVIGMTVITLAFRMMTRVLPPLLEVVLSTILILKPHYSRPKII